MFFHQLQTTESPLSYLFGCGSWGKAVAVEVVVGDEDWFMDRAAEAGVAIAHFIDTHVHADHYSGGRRLAARAGADCCPHEPDRSAVAFDFHPLKDGDRIEAGNVEVGVAHPPGHTEDSICLLVTDRRRGDQDWFVPTGDTLFFNRVGRPVLADREREMADRSRSYDSLHGRCWRCRTTWRSARGITPGRSAERVCRASRRPHPGWRSTSTRGCRSPNTRPSWLS